MRKLKALGYNFDHAAGDWIAPASSSPDLLAEADAMHAALVNRADRLISCLEGAEEVDELEALGEAIGAFEAVRWPTGKVPGGKG